MASFETRGTRTRVVVRTPSGKRTATFDTLAEARTWAAAAEKKKAVGQLRGPAARDQTNSALFELYLERVASKTDSAKWNKLRIAAMLRDPLANKRVAEMRPHDINEWIQRRLDGTPASPAVSPATVNRELNLLGGAFTYAVRDLRWIETNPCHGCRRPEQGRSRKRPLLTDQELAAIRASTGYDTDPKLRTKTARVGACFLLSLETGIRSGELLRMKPAHYQREARTAWVAAEEMGGRKGSRSGRSTVSSARHVPLTERAIELLDQMLQSMPPEQPYIVGLSDRQRDALWRKARDQAGVADLHFHDTKHEAATRLAKHLDVIALSHALGTKDIRLLRDTYYVVDASVAAQKLPRTLRG